MSNGEIIPSRYMTVTAEYLRTTVQGIYGLVKRRRIFAMPGSPGRLLFTRESLDRFLAAKPRSRKVDIPVQEV